MTATLREIHAASSISSLLSSEWYHFRVGELAGSHTVTSLDALNENTTIERMGMYRNAKPKPRQVKNEVRALVIHRAAADSPRLHALVPHHEGHQEDEQQDGHRARHRPGGSRRTHPTARGRS